MADKKRRGPAGDGTMPYGDDPAAEKVKPGAKRRWVGESTMDFGDDPPPPSADPVARRNSRPPAQATRDRTPRARSSGSLPDWAPTPLRRAWREAHDPREVPPDGMPPLEGTAGNSGMGGERGYGYESAQRQGDVDFFRHMQRGGAPAAPETDVAAKIMAELSRRRK